MATKTAKISGSKAAATNMTKTLKLLKMQQFMFLMILMVIINAAKISAKTDIEKALDFRQKCIESSKLSEDQVKLIDEHKLYTKYNTLANTPKEVQCYNACYLEAIGVFINGKPNEQFFREHLTVLITHQEKADDFWNKCMKLEGKDDCEISFNFIQCGIKEAGLKV